MLISSARFWPAIAPETAKSKPGKLFQDFCCCRGNATKPGKLFQDFCCCRKTLPFSTASAGDRLCIIIIIWNPLTWVRVRSRQVASGLAGDTFPVTQRIIVYPTVAYTFEGVFSVDEVFTAGVNEGLTLSGAFGESYQIELAIMPNDDTNTKMLISTSAGFNDYFIPDTILTFMPDGTLHFDDTFDPGNPVIRFFRIMEITSSSSNFLNGTLQADGELGEFGPYQFILTKM